MALIGFLILFPLVAAIALFCIRNNEARNVIVVASAIIIAVASVILVATNLGAGFTPFEFSSEALDFVCTGISVAIVAVILGFSWKYKNIWAALLACVQLIMVLALEFGFRVEIEVPFGLYFDSLSLLMTFIIGVVGSGICVYAIGYMEDFQAHQPEGEKDRRPLFFGLMFLFLSAMFVIVFSNNMEWLFTGWEITTLCSFLLIGFTRTPEAIKNAFRQIIMNLAGGLGFVVALYWCALQVGTFSLYDFLVIGCHSPEVVALAVLGFAFAGITKAAQMPFHTWLLGAMVAPTPTSALLHSSTMVKAGVFLLVKLAPVFMVSPVASLMVIMVGAITFLLCSFMAISQSNAKRVLAYSTIANLGLVTACAGVGSPEAVWAACFLILFHALAKSLLFLCVGTAEHHIGSRDIEDMDLLFDRMPRLARFMMVGIMGMFIAPFGMLIAKWGALVSFAEADQVALILILGFGSAATFMFWAKWLGKLAGIAGQPENVETTVHKSEWWSLLLMVALLICACVALPVVSVVSVEPYIVSVFGTLGQDISTDNLWLAVICAVVVFVALFAGAGRSTSKQKQVPVYLAGVSRDNDSRAFQNSLSDSTEAVTRNWYMESIFGEKRIAPIGVVFNSVLMAAALAIVLLNIGIA